MGLNGYIKAKSESDKLRSTPLFHYEGDETSGFDIPAVIDDLKHEPGWLAGEISTVLLLNSPSIKVLLTLLHEGTEVISFQANESVTFQVLEGSLIIHIRDESVNLQKGELLTLDEKIKYSFDTVEETAFLLTLVSAEGKE